MTVIYIYQDQYPWDIRVDKIVNSIAGNGIETHIVSRNRDGLPIFEQLGDNLYVNRLPKLTNKIIRTLCNFPAFFSPFWIIAILSVINKRSVDLLIVRDLPLALTALFLGKIKKIPVMIDMAENYPAMINDTWKYRGPKFLDFIIRNPWFLRKMEKIVLPKMDAILVVSKQSAERVIDMGVDSNKAFIVSNTPLLDNALKINHDIENEFRKLSEFIILYVGGMEEPRGLKTVVLALPIILKSIPDALFCIVGKGSSELMLKKLADTLGVSNHVFFAGWKEQSEVPSIIAASDVCIVPHYVSEHIDTTVPNKIFDYMVQKKPVIVTNARSLIDIVVNSECGKIYPDKDFEFLAKTIIEMRDYRLRAKYGDNGFAVVHDKYNWKIDEKSLFDALQRVTGTANKGY
jgi:glycosyltransferase involved in cell wall biosynthesis